MGLRMYQQCIIIILVFMCVLISGDIRIKYKNRKETENCIDSNCIRKCCGKNQFYNISENACTQDIQMNELYINSNDVIHGFPNCKYPYYKLTYTHIDVGDLYTSLKHYRRNSLFTESNGDYCVDTFVESVNDFNNYLVTCSKDVPKKAKRSAPSVYICDKKNDSSNETHLMTDKSLITVLKDKKHWIYDIRYLSDVFYPEIVTMNCPDNFLEVTLVDGFLNGSTSSLDTSTRSVFSFTESGDLIYRHSEFIFTPYDYCIYYDFNKLNKVVLKAHVCIKPPSIPRCCSNNQIYDKGLDECRDVDEPVPLYPFVQFGTKSHIWPKSLTGPEVKMSCKINETLTSMQIRDEDSLAEIFYDVDDLHLKFKWSSTDFPLLLDPSSFCIASLDQHNMDYHAFFCFDESKAETQSRCSNTTCFRKCCRENESFSLTSKICTKAIPGFQYVDQLPRPETENYQVERVYGFPICLDFYALNEDIDDYQLQPNGTLYIPVRNELLQGDEYCIDNFFDNSGTLLTFPLVCFKEEHQSVKYNNDSIASLTISVVLVNMCPLIVLLLYGSVKHWRISMCKRFLLTFVLVVICTDVGLLIVYMDVISSREACRFVAWATHFSLLSSYFWFTLMCYDIWKVVRNETSLNCREKVSSRKFLHFVAWASIIPFILSTISVTVSCLHYTEPSGTTLLGFGTYCSCYTGHKIFTGLFWFIVVSLMAMNVGFFVHLFIWNCQRKDDNEISANHNGHANTPNDQVTAPLTTISPPTPLNTRIEQESRTNLSENGHHISTSSMLYIDSDVNS